MIQKINPSQVVWNLLSSKEPDSRIVSKKEETNLRHVIRWNKIGDGI